MALLAQTKSILNFRDRSKKESQTSMIRSTAGTALSLTARDVPLRSPEKENKRDYSKRTPSGTKIIKHRDDPFLPPMPRPVQAFRICSPRSSSKLLFGSHWGASEVNELDKLDRMNLPSPTKQTFMKALFSDVTPASLMRFSSYQHHYAPPVVSGSPSIATPDGSALYIPATFGFLKYTQSSMVPYKDTCSHPNDHSHYYYSPLLQSLKDDRDRHRQVKEAMRPFPLKVVGTCVLPVVLPHDSRHTFLVQFLLVEDIFPLNGPSSRDIDIVIDIDGIAMGTFWPHARGVVPVIEKGTPKLHINERRLCEVIAVGVIKELDKDTKKGKVGVGAWFGKGSLYNYATTVNVDFKDSQYHWLDDEDTAQMVAFTFALEKLAAMFMETAVITSGIRLAIPSEELVRILAQVEDLKVFPSKKGWSWLAAMEFYRRLKYKVELEYLDLQRCSQAQEVLDFAKKGERKLSREMVFSPSEIWAYSDMVDKRGCRWTGHKDQKGKKLLKELERSAVHNHGRWDDSRRRGIYEIRESDWVVRGFPQFLDACRCRRTTQETIPRIGENKTKKPMAAMVFSGREA